MTMCCVFAAAAETGTTASPDQSGICAELCSSDDGCGAGQKCMSNGCGHVCVKERDCSVSDVVAAMEQHQTMFSAMCVFFL